MALIVWHKNSFLRAARGLMRQKIGETMSIGAGSHVKAWAQAGQSIHQSLAPKNLKSPPQKSAASVTNNSCSDENDAGQPQASATDHHHRNCHKNDSHMTNSSDSSLKLQLWFRPPPAALQLRMIPRFLKFNFPSRRCYTSQENIIATCTSLKHNHAVKFRLPSDFMTDQKIPRPH